jgi:hypothetical protein
MVAMRRSLCFSTVTVSMVIAGCGTSLESAPPVVIAPVAASATSPVAITPPAASAPIPITPSAKRTSRRSDAEARDLGASIQVAILMLEAKEHRAFLLEFVAPEDVPHFEKDGGIDGILPGFIREKADALLVILRKMQSVTPTREGRRATFELPGEKDLTWIEDAGRWYLKN